MKVYVDELPKSCGECFCSFENTWCALSDGEMGDICEECDNKTRHKKCPLKTLADYTKQVRKEVLDELCNMLADRAELIDFGGCAEFMFTTYDLQECSKELLDQVQGE